jgi:hypothetical protein
MQPVLKELLFFYQVKETRNILSLDIPAHAFLGTSNHLSKNNFYQELAYIISIFKTEKIMFPNMILVGGRMELDDENVF